MILDLHRLKVRLMRKQTGVYRIKKLYCSQQIKYLPCNQQLILGTVKIRSA